MTAKDYEIIAAIIARLPANIRQRVAREFAEQLATGNDRFKPRLFYPACGVPVP
jgi:hypothetical protein